jgi:hypothetical protein
MASEKQPFVVPAGLVFEVEKDGVSIENDGDIELHGTLGHRVKSVRSISGDVTIHVDAEVGDIYAPEGRVTIRGNLKAHRVAGADVDITGEAVAEEIAAAGGSVHLRARAEIKAIRGATIHIEGPWLTAKIVHGTRSVSVGPGRIQADIVMAPSVDLDPKTVGKITVIECHNDPGPNGVKGGLSLADLDELFGNATSFLEDRGLKPLGAPAKGGDKGADKTGDKVDKVIELTPRHAGRAEPEEEVDEIEVEEDEGVVDLTGAARTDAAEPEHEDGRAAAGEPDTDGEDRAARGAEGAEDPLHQQLVDTVARIGACYADKESPPAVTRLQQLVTERDYPTIRSDITEIWNQLLKYHQKKGMRIQPQVTTTFNAINSIVRKL